MGKMSTRYYFCAAIILASLAVFCNCYNVIIIGAGASGIAAGMFLLNNGIKNFVILEAEDRIGGRINSTKFGESFVDLGAEWCLGEEGNRVYSIAKDSDKLRPVNDNYTFCFSKESSFLDYPDSAYKNVRRNFSDVFLNVFPNSTDPSLSTAFYYYIYTKLYSLDHSQDEFRALLHQFKPLMSMALSHESFFSWDSTQACNRHRKCNGQLQNFNGEGFSKIFQIMMNESPYAIEKDILHTKIIYNSEIEKINWMQYNKTGVTVRNTNGDVYHSKYVIFTPSLGVLKEKHSSLFEPALPQSKQDAIDCSGFEGVIKVFLQWDNPFWFGGYFPPILLLWDDDSLRELRNNTKFFLPGNNTDPWILSLTQFLPSPSNPKVLAAWFTGEMSKEIEQLSDDDLVEGIMFVLDTFLPKQLNEYVIIYNDVGKPDKILRSSWNSNPHFLGSHSFESCFLRPASEGFNKELANPLYRSDGKPVVLFAGEATSKHHYSTVHGAIESGEREGERVILALSDI